MLGRRGLLPARSMEKLNRSKRSSSARGVFWYAIPAACALWILLFCTRLSDLRYGAAAKDGHSASASTTATATATVTTRRADEDDPCSGKYIYVHNLPDRFNADMLRDCRNLSAWTDMCVFTSNAGLGPPIDNTQPGWYATNQFTVEVIFHNRMKQYRCLTNDSTLASAVFVPYYAGLDVARYLWGYNTTVRDSGALDLLRWLRSKPQWEVMGGRDHFFVAGRITWDFRRLTDDESDWGNKLLVLPEPRNMTALVVEASPWNSNDFAIPYPTYFHPSKDSDVFLWQDRMRRMDRPWLFSFAGAPRPNLTISIRDRIIAQCRSSTRCLLLECESAESKCHSPSSVTNMFQTSVFCLQPQGDSYTRRSVFDSMLAACIPVFFHPGTAYIQYLWHLPTDYTRYSVFISEDDIRNTTISIHQVLAGISQDKVRKLREEVITMIPTLLYADPRSKLTTVRDAFDVAVDSVIRRVDQLRTELRGEGNFSRFQEKNSWKYALVGSEGPHHWDHYFFKPNQCRPCR